MKIYAYSGKIGAGKSYMVSQDIQKLKNMGQRIFILSFADPIKWHLEEAYGLVKGDTTRIGVSSWITRELLDEHLIKFLRAAMNKILSAAHYEFTTWTYYEKKIDEIVAEKGDFVFELLKNINHSNQVDHYRKLMQFIGTEIAQSVYENIWVDNAMLTVDFIRTTGVANVVIFDDVRFTKEYDGIKKYVEGNKDVDLIFKMVHATLETRMSRTGLTADQIDEMSDHPSEIEIDFIEQMIPATSFVDNN